MGAGFSTPPEQVRAIEVGAKWDLGSNLDLNMALFRTETSEGRFPAAVAGGVTIPNVECKRGHPIARFGWPLRLFEKSVETRNAELGLSRPRIHQLIAKSLVRRVAVARCVL